VRGVGAVVRWLGAADRGSPALEMGAVASLMFVLISGALEFGLVLFQIMEVDNALEGGMAYAAAYYNPNTSDASMTSISSSVGVATGLSGVSANPAPLAFCGCATGDGLVCAGGNSVITDNGSACSSQYQGNCTAKCTGGFTAGYYVTVSAQYTLPPGFNRIPGFANLLQATGTVRVK